MKRKKIYNILLLLYAIVSFSFVLTIASKYYTKSYLGVVGNVCEITSENPHGWCYENLPMGGFPFIYIKDSTATSVIGGLSFLTDEIFWDKFFLDWGFYMIIPIILSYFYFRIRQTKSA